MDSPNVYKLDKTVLTTADFAEAERADLEFWRSQTPQERFHAMELMRRINYGESACSARMQKILTVVERGSSEDE